MEILSASKTHLRSQGRLPCLGTVETINLTRGCAGQCAFCYARCYRGAPPPGKLLLYNGLPDQLRRELTATRRRRSLPDFVILCSAGDPFLGGPQVLAATRDCIDILLNHDIGVSLSTRGVIDDETLRLLTAHASRVRVAVSIASLSTEYTRAWEPGTASADKRLFVIQRLQRGGLIPKIRIEPLIPFVNDDSASIRDLASALVGLGITEAMVSFLQLRRGVAEQLRKEAPEEAVRLVLGCFPSTQDTGTPTEFDHIEPRQALSGLRRIQALAQERGLQVAACRCQNPGLPTKHCAIAPPEKRSAPPQEQLFPS